MHRPQFTLRALMATVFVAAVTSFAWTKVPSLTAFTVGIGCIALAAPLTVRPFRVETALVTLGVLFAGVVALCVSIAVAAAAFLGLQV